MFIFCHVPKQQSCPECVPVQTRPTTLTLLLADVLRAPRREEFCERPRERGKGKHPSHLRAGALSLCPYLDLIFKSQPDRFKHCVQRSGRGVKIEARWQRGASPGER